MSYTQTEISELNNNYSLNTNIFVFTFMQITGRLEKRVELLLLYQLKLWIVIQQYDVNTNHQTQQIIWYLRYYALGQLGLF